MPDYIVAAAIATEDLKFFDHKGFRVPLIRRALIFNIENGRYVYGGSTISQQLVKNLYFSLNKNLARKFAVAIVTWQMEQVVSKERILELYLNCIEYGPGIYGLKEAAKVYFGKKPADLAPVEAAFIMGLKPSPKYGYLVYKSKKLPDRWQDKLKKIMNRLRQLDVISDEDLQTDGPYVLNFHYD